MEREIIMKFRKFFTALTAVALCLTVSSCGKAAPEPETASKEHVYREDKIELADGLSEINNVFYTEDKIYLLGTKNNYDENDNLQVSYPFYVMGLDGTVEKETVLDFKVTNILLHISGACVDSEGTIAVIVLDYASEIFTLYRFSADGEQISKNQISGLSDIADRHSELEGFLPLDGGRYLIAAGTGAALINAEGETEKLFNDSNPAESSYTSGFCQTADGRIFMIYTNMTWDDKLYIWNEETVLIEIDIENGSLGRRYNIQGKGTFLNGTDKYDLLISRESGLVGLDLETEKTEIILDWIKSGIDKGSIRGDISILPDGRILFQNMAYKRKSNGADFSYDNMYISVLTEIPPEELPDRKLIKLFALNLDDLIRSQMLEFNKNNPEYEIELTSYADYEDGLEKMNADMIAGNVPDVLVLGKDGIGYDILADSYISKGLLANLYDFMDGDPNFRREDFLENYLKAHEVDGKLYEIAPAFSINTYAAKTSRVGEKEGWTMEEFSAVTEEMTGEEIYGSGRYTSDWILNEFLFNCSDSYIDRSKGKCRFDSEEFISVLKFCNKFPSEQPEEGPYNDEIYSRLRDDRQLLDFAIAGTPNYIRTEEKGIFGEAVTYKGYPCSVGNGSSFNDAWGIKFAISSKTPVPEGAWRFVKSFLSEEYQKNMYSEAQSGAIPIRLTAIEKRFENEQKPLEYTDGNGDIHVEEGNWFFFGSSRIDMGYPDAADSERTMKYIKSITTVQRKDKYVSKIVQEEAGAYFAGQKSAEEVAETIQNRVQNYIDENR